MRISPVNRKVGNDGGLLVVKPLYQEMGIGY